MRVATAPIAEGINSRTATVKISLRRRTMLCAIFFMGTLHTKVDWICPKNDPWSFLSKHYYNQSTQGVKIKNDQKSVFLSQSKNCIACPGAFALALFPSPC